ncbi:hypothetical protein L208DRAFT_1398615 [Tricholoma matsutake]|nr:hypothetical protein L208DRAFT_1398611 [Tricholoma matsutake 945]KAF8231637.1 hypothetical protein L208DRAFT_1398615 [Tricholoma matsutake 945]
MMNDDDFAGCELSAIVLLTYYSLWGAHGQSHGAVLPPVCADTANCKFPSESDCALIVPESLPVLRGPKRMHSTC